MIDRDASMGPDGLTRRDRDLIRDVLARYPDVRRVTLFGSRAMGTFGRGSDIDLALEGRDLDAHTLTRIATELEDSDLPYKVDLLLRDEQLEPKLEAHIRRHGKPFGLPVNDSGDSRTISNQWRSIPFSQAAVINPTVRLQRGGMYPFVDMSAVDSSRPTVRLSEERAFTGGGSRFESGDTLFARITPCLENGKIARFLGIVGDGRPAHGSTEFIVLRGRNDVSISDFVFYLSRSPLVRGFAISQMTGSSGRQRVPTDCFDKLNILLPPLDEQRAIAGVLGALDDKIEQNRRTAQALERLARVIFRAWFVNFEPVKAKAAGATTFPSMPQPVFDALPTRFVDSAIGPVPEGWAVKAIGDVVTVKGGGTPSTKNPEYWDGGEHCWATPKDMSHLSHPVLLDTERRITGAGVNAISSGILPVGTVLMSSRAPVGYLAIAGVPTAINQGFIAMVCDGPLPPTYVLNWAFASMDTIKANASGTTFPEISKKNFRPLPVVFPTPDVIAAYQQAADPLFYLLTVCVKESEQLTAVRDYLLPKLLSGTVRIGRD